MIPLTWAKPFGKMDPKRQTFAPGKREWRRRKKPMFSGGDRAKLFSRGK